TGARAGAWISVRVVPVPHGRPQRRRVDLQQSGDVRLPVRTWRAQTSLPPGYEIPVEGGGAGDGIELFGEAGLRPSPLDPESRQHVTDNLTQRDLLDVLGKRGRGRPVATCGGTRPRPHGRGLAYPRRTPTEGAETRSIVRSHGAEPVSCQRLHGLSSGRARLRVTVLTHRVNALRLST